MNELVLEKLDRIEAKLNRLLNGKTAKEEKKDVKEKHIKREFFEQYRQKGLKDEEIVLLYKADKHKRRYGKNLNRMSFFCKRAWAIMKEKPNVTKSEAFRIARDEWNITQAIKKF